MRDTWEKALISKDASIRDVLEVISNESYRIALVVDDTRILLGTISDGDIRRALLAGKTLDSSAWEIMNNNPLTAAPADSREEISNRLINNDILCLPVIENGKVVELETLNNIVKAKKFDNPIFLMAGGFGTRLKPLTDETPKPLLKVGNKPILEIIIDKFIDEGFSNFYISTHFLAEKIVDHFGDGSLKGVSIEYIHEKRPMGTAGALGLLPQDKINSPIIMMNGDLLSKVNFADLLSYHHENSGEITMCISEYEFQVPYGVINIDKERLKGIDEKPSHKFFINAGIYVVEPSVISRINDNAYIDMPTLLDEMIENDIEINVFPIHEYWLDVGRIDDFNKAKEEIAKDDQQ